MKIKTAIERLIPTSLLVVVLSLMPKIASAACNDAQGIDGGADCGKTNDLTLTGSIVTITNTLLFIVGIASVIVIIVGGLRYILSGGDPKNTTAAKDTILYAAIGLVVALLGYAIVNFVITQFIPR